MAKGNNYGELLERAKSLIPEEISETKRLKIPNVKGHKQGKKTIVKNFFQICKVLDRDPKHVLKFLSKELASKTTTRKKTVFFNNRLSGSKINKKIKKYADTFVICKECKKPETKLKEKDNILLLKCNACGAEYPIRYRL